MLSKAVRITVAALLFQAVLMVGPALAQDFNSFMSSAASLNQQWVNQTDLELQATDLATLQSRTSTALATGKQVESLLNQALSVASTDAERSRVQGLLAHVTAAEQSGNSALQDTDLNVARSDVNAMRGEAQEALSELAPFQTAASAPAQLPSAGEYPSGLLGESFTSVLAMIGLVAVMAGLGLRRRFA